MKNLIGSTINQYQILVKIRETGTRILYKAYDTQSYKHVGIDVVKIHVVDQPKLLDLLKNQSKKNAELTHANIAVVIDSGIYDDIIFIVYNFIPLHSLRPLFNRTYSWQELSQELVPITLALSLAHEKGIYHCFLNPSSIVMDENKHPILFDFGLEQIIVDHIISYSPSSWINNWGFEYCSPEQLMSATADGRSDVYAMGMILYKWASGEIAFLEDSALTTLKKRTTSSSQKIDLNKIISPTVRNLIQKCLSADPSDRFQTMQELSILLARGALDLPVTEKMVQRPLSIAASNPSLIRWSVIPKLILLVSMTIVLGLLIKTTSIIQNVELLQPTANSIPPISSAMGFATFTPQGLTPEISPMINPNVTQLPETQQFSYPLYEETPLSSLTDKLQVSNADQLINLSLWGIGDVNRLAVSPDGIHFAVASSIGVFIYDINTLELQKQLDTRSWVSAVEFSPDGKIIAVGDRDGLIRLWDTNLWQEIASYSSHRLGVLDMAFSPDGTKLASVAMDNTLVQWEIDVDENAGHISVPVSGVTCVVFSQDGSTIGTGGNDFKINLWDTNDLNLLSSITISSKVVDMTTINNSNSLAVGGSDRRVTIVDIEGNTIVRQLEDLQYTLSSVASSPNGEYLAGGDINGGIVIWDRNGDLFQKIPNLEGIEGSSNSLGNAHSLVFSTDGKSIISGLRNGTFRVINTVTGKEILQNQSLDVHTEKFAISYDSKYVISQNNNGRLKVWDLYGGKQLYELEGEIKAGNPFSQNNQYFAVATNQSTVKVDNIISGKEYYVFNGHQGIVTIKFINNGAQLAIGHEQRMHLWSMSSGQEIQTDKSFSGNGCTIFSDLKENPLFYITKYNHIFENNSYRYLCAFQKPDWMKTLFISEFNGQVAFGGNNQLASSDYQNAMEMSGANKHNIVRVAINPDGSLLAAAFDDNTIHIWDIVARSELMSLFGHNSSITDLQFTPDGKLLISSSLDGTIRLWGDPN